MQRDVSGDVSVHEGHDEVVLLAVGGSAEGEDRAAEVFHSLAGKR